VLFESMAAEHPNPKGVQNMDKRRIGDPTTIPGSASRAWCRNIAQRGPRGPSRHRRLVTTLLALAVSMLAGPAGAQENLDPNSIRSMSIKELLNVRVSVASRVLEQVTDAPGVITVVTRDELERFGGTTLKDVLERVPSLISSTDFFTDRSAIAARGDLTKSTSSHMLFLINGRPIRESLEGGISTDVVETFPINIISRIEVIRGPGSVIYGTDAFSAVVNIITEDANRDGGSLAAFGGPDGVVGGFGEAKVAGDELSVVAAARYLKQPDYDVTWNYHNVETGEFGSLDLSIPNRGGSAFVDLGYKGLSATLYYDRYETSYFLGMFGASGVGTWERTFANVGYDLKIGDDWDSDFNFTYARSQLDATQAYPSIIRDTHDYLAEWTNTINLSRATRLLVGASYDYVDGSELFTGASPAFPIVDNSRSIAALYGQIDVRPTDKLMLIGGFQVNKVENVDVDLVPRIGLIWNPTSKVNVKALYSEAFRAPSINEFHLDHPTRKGNLDLRPEKIATTDLSVGYLGHKGQLAATVFHSVITDTISAVYVGAMGQYQNTGEIKFNGVELEGKVYINKSLMLTGSALYQENENEDGEENMSPIANLELKAGISYRSDNGLTLSLFNIYQGDLDAKYDGVLNPDPEAYNKLSLYGRFELNELFDLDIAPDLALFIQVDNALDKEIWLPEWGLTPDTIPVNQGRMAYIGFEATF
jgi:outer membrane receptor for ferrienterochelin and colicins